MNIDRFEGDYQFLSNFYVHEFELLGERWPSVEHAYQALKAVKLEDYNKVRLAATPAIAKKLGRKIKVRSDWEYVKVPIMTCLVRQKFMGSSILAAFLLATGDAQLTEGNWWKDTFWGVCNGQGLNMLGKILMSVREELRLLLAPDNIQFYGCAAL